jgi:hypothetical protein
MIGQILKFGRSQADPGLKSMYAAVAGIIATQYNGHAVGQFGRSRAGLGYSV